MAQSKTSAFPTASAFLPAKLALPQLRSAAADCQGCDLYKFATQTVFGEGPRKARVVFVGEQPGDQEDKTGQPFVGPSGHLLDTILEKVGIDRSQVYVTNAVKHFKFQPRGKRRIHAKPTAREIKACQPWLEAEIKVVKPDVIVALGATAAQSMLGGDFKVTRQRGKKIEGTKWGRCVVATVHPSSLLRAPDERSRHEAMAAFERDLRIVKKLIDKNGCDGATGPVAAKSTEIVK